MRKMLIIMMLCHFPLLANATEVDGATIKRLMLDRNLPGRAFIQLSKRQTATIDCHENLSWEYVLDITDDLGKNIYSNLLLIYSTGREAYFRGMDDCSLYGNIETLRRVELK